MILLWLRWLAATAFFAASLFAVLRAPTMRLWMLSIVVKEYGHWIAPLALLPLLGVSPANGAGAALWAVSLASAVFFASSAIRAVWFSRGYAGRLRAAFGAPVQPLRRAPLGLAKLWLGESIPSVVSERFVFASHQEKELALYFYRAQKRENAPCVIMIHGGGWEYGSPAEFPKFNELLAHRGYAVASIEYRLTPHACWPAPHEDARAALQFLKDHREPLGISGERFVIMGRSAGGQIAEAVAFEANDPAILGCIAFYAPADLEFAYGFGSETDMLESPRLLRQYLNGTPAEQPENYRTASPIQFVKPSTPPVLLIHGPGDPLVWNLQSQRLAARLAENGVRHLHIELPWATHAFDYNPNGPSGQLSTYAVLHFLRAVMP